MNIQGWHIVIIIVLAIVLFGAPKLPGLARSVGQSLRIFKSEVKQMKDENNTGEAGADPVEGRVVNNSPQPQANNVTYPGPAQHQGTAQNLPQAPQAPHYQGSAPGDGPGQAGPAQQSGTSHSSK